VTYRVQSTMTMTSHSRSHWWQWQAIRVLIIITVWFAFINTFCQWLTALRAKGEDFKSLHSIACLSSSSPVLDICVHEHAWFTFPAAPSSIRRPATLPFASYAVNSASRIWDRIFRMYGNHIRSWEGNVSVTRPPPWSSGQNSPALPDFLRSSGSGEGSAQPREYNWGATWKKK
jgi:hypothetical protein